jgi:predicted AAA+ superfamily ATPase
MQIVKRPIFGLIERQLESNEAVVITGMRRTGKTTILEYLYQGMTSTNKIMLDLENPLNRKYFETDNYETIISDFRAQNIDFTKKSYVFLDEIQYVKNIPSVVKYLIDHYQVKFFLTGSASFYLKNLFSESLSGRKLLYELFPLSFKEFLMFKGSSLAIPDQGQTVSSVIYSKLANLYDEYVEYGGFPGVVLKTNAEDKKSALQDIFTSFFQLEVMQLGDFKRNDTIRDLMLLLMERIGAKLDIQKVSRELGISRPTLNDYVAFLEGTYFIKTIKPFSRGKDTEIRKASKVYICDCGLANCIAKVPAGSLFENSVFQNLRLRGTLNYYQRKSGAEVDFIVDKNTAYEVKLNAHPSDLNKLRNIATSLGLSKYRIVAGRQSPLENITYGFML